MDSNGVGTVEYEALGATVQRLGTAARAMPPTLGWRRLKLDDEARKREGRVLRGVRLTWCLLFFNVLGSGYSPILHIPHRVAQVLTQGALGAAVLVALWINPRLRIRSSLYLAVFAVLGVTSLMASVRFVSVGTDYRALRILAFIGVLWLLTPWWGRRDLLLLRVQVGFLLGILGSAVAGIVLSPGAAFGGGRLGGAVWPIAATQLAHYAAELSGLAIVLWASQLSKRSTAAGMSVASFIILILTHTRTALLAEVLGVTVALVSLFTVRRRVRRAFAAFLMTVALVGVPLAPLAVTWLARGQSAGQLASLTGRTQFWSYVFAEHRNLTQRLIGDGISNGSINPPASTGAVSPGAGLAIDSSWVLDYQDQGIIGDMLTGLLFVVLLGSAAVAPSGPRKALALFLTIYCLVASFTEDGAGIASQYAMDMTLAASLLVPELHRRGRGRSSAVK